MSQVIFEKPPRFDEISKLFGVTEKDVIFYSHGDNIYSPTGKMPSDDLIIHEQMHAEQQAHDETGAKLWWERYLRDPEWRVEQEAEAYGAQYKWICGRVKDRNARARWLHSMAVSLSSEMYGKCVDYQEASKKIKLYAEGGAMRDIEKALPDVEDPTS